MTQRSLEKHSSNVVRMSRIPVYSYSFRRAKIQLSCKKKTTVPISVCVQNSMLWHGETRNCSSLVITHRLYSHCANDFSRLPFLYTHIVGWWCMARVRTKYEMNEYADYVKRYTIPCSIRLTVFGKRVGRFLASKYIGICRSIKSISLTIRVSDAHRHYIPCADDFYRLIFFFLMPIVTCMNKEIKWASKEINNSYSMYSNYSASYASVIFTTNRHRSTLNQ